MKWILQVIKITLNLPDRMIERLKALAAAKRMSVNQLMEELSTQAIAEFDSEIRFRAMARRGDKTEGVELLDKLDRNFGA